MRVLLQRVKRASVTIGGELYSSIDGGLLVFVGIENADGEEDIEWLAKKVTQLRIFDDENGVMNLDVRQIDGDILVVSQFTLQALTKHGNRPSYIRAAREDVAVPIYESFVARLREIMCRDIPTGVFGADMQVELINDGPVTIWIDSKKRDN